jgi:hypothetical protein
MHRLRIRFHFLVVLLWSVTVAEAQPVPRVELVYPSPNGSTLDWLCTDVFKGKIEPAWVQEAIQRLPEFQARWDKEGPAYFAVARRETGLDYPFREVQATLSVCEGVPSMGTPLITQVRGFLSSTKAPPRPAMLFPMYIFHDMMYRYTTPVRAVSQLRKKYASESPQTLNELHVVAMEMLVLVKLGKSEELKAWRELNRTERSAARVRTWDIVEKESYESFVNEFKLVKK